MHGNNEIPFVTVVTSRDFPTPLQQFELAVKERYASTARTLYGRYPELQGQFEEILLNEPLEGPAEDSILQQQWERLAALSRKAVAKGGSNNNNRFKRSA